jgi:hypothetical protein
VWATLCFHGGQHGLVDLSIWWKGDGEEGPTVESAPLTFELYGSEGADPDDLASLIEDGVNPMNLLN